MSQGERNSSSLVIGRLRDKARDEDIDIARLYRTTTPSLSKRRRHRELRVDEARGGGKRGGRNDGLRVDVLRFFSGKHF